MQLADYEELLSDLRSWTPQILGDTEGDEQAACNMKVERWLGKLHSMVEDTRMASEASRGNRTRHSIEALLQAFAASKCMRVKAAVGNLA